MAFVIDRSMHWTDHYVEYGFAVIEKAVGPEFIEPAMREARELLQNDLPLPEWNADNAGHKSLAVDGKMKVLPKVYDQPGVRSMIDTMFGSPDAWNGKRSFSLFVNAYDEKSPASVKSRGHIDFVNCPVPILGSGFMFQVSLVKSEPFSGNLTLFPGTHKKVQRALVDDPNRRFPKDLASLLECEPYEFIANPGDMVLFHHLVGHAGNPSHADNRVPRVGLHCQALHKQWLREIDPSAKLSPWQRSLATAGAFRPPYDEEKVMAEYYASKGKVAPVAPG